MARYTPIIIISARSSEVQRILGLEIGADDYLAKPFSVLELVARVKALLRRVEALAQNARLESGSLSIDGLAMDPVARDARLHGARLDLTPREFDLLYFFARQPGKVFSRMDLLNAVWGYQHEGYEHTVNTHINRLRAKIEADPAQPARILTVWGAATSSPKRARAHDHETAPDTDPAPVPGLCRAAAGVQRHLGLDAAARQPHARAGSGAGPVARRGRKHCARRPADRRQRPHARRRAQLLQPAHAGQPQRGGLPAGRRRPHCRPCRPDGRVRRERVDLAPVHRLLEGGTLPILGDDPRSTEGRKVFSAAPLRVNGKEVGFIYVVLQGEAHDQLVAQGSANSVLSTALWSIGLVALLCLVAGLVAFALITRPLRRLTEEVAGFDIHGTPGPAGPQPGAAQDSRDEIAVLDAAYRRMVARIGEQWRALTRQDQERRELIANVSHDLRTPLSSLHGYLETLLLRDAVLDTTERRRYLGIALAQSQKVGELAQSLFELARLEYGFVQPEPEPFSMPDLVQDVFQKFELRAEARQVALRADFPARLPVVQADLGMIERVLGNLLDNALRHTPKAAASRWRWRRRATPSKSPWPTPAPASRPICAKACSSGPSPWAARRGGGLGLRIVHRMLELHGCRIELVDPPGQGRASGSCCLRPRRQRAPAPGRARADADRGLTLCTARPRRRGMHKIVNSFRGPTPCQRLHLPFIACPHGCRCATPRSA